MNKIYILVLSVFLCAGFIACEDDECDRLHIDKEMVGIPTVMKGSFPVGTLNPTVGDSIIFAPVLYDTTGVKYLWTLNGKEVCTDSVFTFKVEKPCRAKVSCELKNSQGKVTMVSDIVSKHDLTKGALVVQKGSIDFYDMQTGKLYYDVYSALNFGTGLGLGDYTKLYAVSGYGKVYMLISTSTSNVKHLFRADRQTLNQENSAEISANLDAFILLNEKQALVTGGGVYRVDLSSFAKTRIYNKYGWAIYNAIEYNGKLLANMTYSDPAKVCYYDVDALLSAKEGEMPEATELDIVQNGKMNFVKTGDGNIYTTGYDQNSGKYYLAQISSDFSVKKVILPFKPKYSGYSAGLYAAGLAVSKSGDAIYIPAEDRSIYKYIPGDPSSLGQPLIKAPEGDETLYGAGINVNPENGEIWACYVEEVGRKEYTGKIIIYDVSGNVMRSIDCGSSVPQAVLFNN